MCRSMTDIQSATVEKKKKIEEETTGQKYNEWPAVLHRAAITTTITLGAYYGNAQTARR